MVNGSKLPQPFAGIQKRAVVITIVVWTVSFCVNTWCDDGHFVPVDRITPEKVFHLFGNLTKTRVMFSARSQCHPTKVQTYHGRRTHSAPDGGQLAEHGIRTAEELLPKASKLTQFGVSHAHVLLIRLDELAIG